MRLESVDKAITIQSSNVHLGDRLPEYAREHILRVASKYFGRLSTAAVHFTKDGIIPGQGISDSGWPWRGGSRFSAGRGRCHRALP